MPVNRAKTIGFVNPYLKRGLPLSLNSGNLEIMRRPPIGTLVGIVLALLLYKSGLLGGGAAKEDRSDYDSGIHYLSPAGEVASRTSATYMAFLGKSRRFVEDEGSVERLLEDEMIGVRYQRFLVRLVDGHLVTIAHNLDMSPRVPVKNGDRIKFMGEYEWDEQGGVIRRTHRDPTRRSFGGYVEHAGRRYK